MAPLRSYAVRGVTKRGTVTYNCPTPNWALRKLRDFEGQRYGDIRVTGPDGEPLTADDLEALARGTPASVQAVPEHQT